MSDLGFCVPCAAAVINPAPALLSDWKAGAKKGLLPLVVIAIIIVMVVKHG